jgi:hypothetical protein
MENNTFDIENNKNCCNRRGNICYQDNEYGCNWIDSCVYMCLCACASKDDILIEGNIEFNKGGCFSKYFLINFLCICLTHALVWFLILYFYMIPCFNGEITYSEILFGIVNNNVLQIKNTPCVFNNYIFTDGDLIFLFEHKNKNCLHYFQQIQQNDCDINNFKLTSNVSYSDELKYYGIVIIFIILLLILLWSTTSFISMIIYKINYKRRFGCETT